MKKYWRLIIALSVLLFFAICFIYQKKFEYEEYFMQRKLAREDLVGTWYCSKETLELLKKDGVDSKYINKEENKLILNNNSFECKISLPTKYSPNRTPEHLILKGEWKIIYETKGKYTINILCFNTKESFPENYFLHLRFYINENNCNLRLNKYLTDSKAYVYEKNIRK